MNLLKPFSIMLLTSTFGQSQILDKVIPRAGWNAAPVKEGKAEQYQEQSEKEIRYISIHHTDSSTSHSRWDEKKLLEFVQDFHQNGKLNGARIPKANAMIFLLCNYFFDVL
jgi:ADP-heptose:LPS heptosyltransferase